MDLQFNLPPKTAMTETTKVPFKTSNAKGMGDDKRCLTFVRTESTQNIQNVSWRALHANETERSPIFADFSALLTIWRDSSKFPAMKKHPMMVIAKAIDLLNPFQTPAIKSPV